MDAGSAYPVTLDHYYGKCRICGEEGPRAGTPYDAGRLFAQQAIRRFQLAENPILETHAKYTEDLPLDIRKCSSMTTTQLMPIAEAKEKYGPSLTTEFLNQTLKHLQEALVPTQTEKPYWIIVSDEGHANIPHKHFVKAEAEKEAQRLTELKPGITFTVFEAKSSVFKPKADTKKTVYEVPAPYSYSFGYAPGKAVWI